MTPSARPGSLWNHLPNYGLIFPRQNEVQSHAIRIAIWPFVAEIMTVEISIKLNINNYDTMILIFKREINKLRFHMNGI